MTQKKHMTPLQLIALGFLIVILLGTILLRMPFSQKQPGSLTLVDSAFTAVSAVCVTGLVVVDAEDTFNTIGQTILAILIQIGGLGITSIGVGLISFRRKHMRVRDQVLIQAALNYPTMQDIRELIRSVLLMTLTIEAFGTVIGAIFFYPDYGFPNALGIAAFHSIASFNNAGFDIFGNWDGMTLYADHIGLNLLTAFLIISGGIGFFVIRDILKNRRFSRCSLHTKVVLSMTAILIFGGMLLIKLTENDQISWLSAFFTSVSTRTAGFSVVPLNQFSHAGILLVCLLMYIGAAPGSTGGGVKVTTFYVLIRTILCYPQGKQPNGFRRRFPAGIVQQALVICSLAIAIIFIGMLLLCMLEPDISISFLLLETISAFATVGLSTGITPDLHPISKIILMLIMYIGRLGPLTVASLWFRKQPDAILLPEEEIPVG